MSEASIQKSLNQLTKAEQRQALELYEKARNGDRKALKAFEASYAECRQLMEADGNLGQVMRRDLLERYLGKDEIFKRGIELKAESLERELAGGNPSPLERLLIERVTICWINMYMVDNISSRIHTDGERTYHQCSFHQKWQERSQKRFLSAVKALAQVRKLLGVNVQINIAEQQVNVAG